METYRYAALLQVQTHGQRLAHIHIRIVAAEKGALELLQLPGVEIGAAASTIGGGCGAALAGRLIIVGGR